MTKKVLVDGMECEYCASQVMKALLGIDGINSVDVIFSEKNVIVELLYEVSNDKLEIAVEEAECKVVEIKDL
ncbi:copper chaperone [Clostridium aceticum]|uniref:Copper chaperone n=1 Tax=Clostridium aceticum TaxID=84022 RepID=A0A0D8IAG8_9CLOT|nr:heavy metal-associated domain-containing protein [Clostridium aceticum]AKL96057.1 copper chaperone [Clostridium aceticum]KJF27017.1 hypothetical protein TZ02_09395 [Clostridium aceticum]